MHVILLRNMIIYQLLKLAVVFNLQVLFSYLRDLIAEIYAVRMSVVLTPR